MNSAARATIHDRDGAEWAERSPSEIIEHILERFHEPLHRELPALVASARLVEAAASGQPLCPTWLGAHLEQVLLDVESHLGKEEKILFPLIQAGRGHAAFMPIKVMMAEHEDHTASLARTRELTHDFALPDGASAAWRNLYQELERFEADLQQHIELENNVLFTRVMGGGDA
jgi:regulator of cell morphogenesis and NO signaling